MFTEKLFHKPNSCEIESPKTHVKDLIHSSLAPPRSQSFSGVVQKQVDKAKTTREEFKKRCTLSLDKSTRLKTSTNKPDFVSASRQVASDQRDNVSTSNVIQRTKTFSKYLSITKQEAASFKKNRSLKEKSLSNGIVSAQDEFLLGVDATTYDEKTRAIENNTSNSVFLAKGKLTHLLKTTQIEQLTKLQNKHQKECELLDDIRNFSKQRSQIEKDYGQALQKLAMQYQKREFMDTDKEDEQLYALTRNLRLKNGMMTYLERMLTEVRKNWTKGNEPRCSAIPTLARFSEHLSKFSNLIEIFSPTSSLLHQWGHKYLSTAQNVWKAALDATEQTAQIRISQAENYKNDLSESTRIFRIQKDNQLKKCQEFVTAIHTELTDTVKELSRTKKKYYELDQSSNAAREKYEEVNDRLKKNQTSLFKSKSGLEKALLKLQQKCDESNRNSTIARNEYLLMINAANAHQKRYYEVDLPEAIRVLDGNIFTKLQKYIALISQLELNSSDETQTNFVKSLESTSKISREFETQCFLRENPIFEWAALYEFESSSHDTAKSTLTEEQPGNDNSLNREARRWTFCVEKDKQKLEQLRIQQEEIRSTISETLPGGASEMITQDSEMQIEKCKQEIRKVETSCLLGESRLAVLENANVDLDTWTESAKAQLAKKEPMTTPGGLTYRKMLDPATNSFSIGSPDSHFDEDEDNSDEFDTNSIDIYICKENDTLSIQSNDRARYYPITCTVSYPYQASRIDELTVSVGDKVEVIENGDLDQWVKAKDSSGNVGFVPENYLEFPLPIQAPKFQTFDVKATPFKTAPTSSSPSMSSCSFESGNDHEVSSMTAKARKPLQLRDVCLAKAIYSYEACTEDELSFPIGAVINVVNKNETEVDDGWWKGELNGKIGVFPALVVEEIGCDDRKRDSYVSVNSEDNPIFLQPPLLPTSLNGESQVFGPDLTEESSFEAARPELTSNSSMPSPARRGRLHSEPTPPSTLNANSKPFRRVAPAPPCRPSLLRPGDQ